MSWLFKSPDSNDPDSSHLHRTVIHSSSPLEPRPSDDLVGGSGVKDDITLIFRGVAKFLAPPPSSSSSSVGDSSSLSSQTLTGIRNDLVEIGGSFKSSLSRLSTNKAVTGISKFASQLLQFEGQVAEVDQRQVDGEGCDSDEVPGTTNEVVRFVKEISTRPECWTEFPLPIHNDFCMSSSQREHALTIERLVPELVTLRLNLCSYMNVEKFWMIYFLILLPRLNGHDFECLSTPKIVEARDLLMQKIGGRRNLHFEECEKPRTLHTYQEDRGEEDSEKESIPFEQNQILTDVTNAAKGLEIDDMISTEKWMEETDIDATSLTSCTKLQHEEDVSFSDLEDDESDIYDRLSGHREARDVGGSSPDGCSDWVQLNESSGRGGQQKAIPLKGKDSEDESNEWLTVDDFN